MAEHIQFHSAIGQSFPCCDAGTRILLIAFADASQTLQRGIVKENIDDLWKVLYPNEWEWRQPIFHNVLNISEGYIVVGTSPVKAYMANRAWMSLLWQEIHIWMTITPTMPLCSRLHYKNSPV